MANIKSAKKRARQNVERRQRNLARGTAIKTAMKKVHAALEAGEKPEATQTLLKDVQVQLMRAKGKGLFHANTASRKLSRLAKKVSAATRTK